MICAKCGQNMDENMKFCPNCGADVSAVETTPVAEATLLVEATPVIESMPVVAAVPLVTPPQPPVKKKSKKGWIIAGVSVATVVALVLVCIFTPLISVIKNTWVNLFYSPEQRMAYVYTSAADDIGEGIADAYGAVVNPANEEVSAVSGTIEVEVSSELMSMIPDIPAWLKSINKVAIDYAIEWDEDSQIGASLTAKVKGAELATAKLYADVATGDMVVAVPGILTKPLKMNIAEVFYPVSIYKNNDSADSSMQAVAPTAQSTDMYQMLQSINFDALPSEEFVQKFISKIAKAAFAEIKDVEKSEDTFEASGVSQKATCLKAKITPETLINMASAALKAVKDDKDTEKVIVDFIDANKTLFDGMSGEEAYDAIAEMLDETIDELGDLDVNTDNSLTLKTWVNFSNEILAIEADVEGAIVFIGKAQDGKDVGYDAYVKNGDYVPFRISGKGTEAKNKLNVTLAAYAEGEEYVKLTVKDLDTKQLDNGYINGEFKLQPGEALAKEMPELKDFALRFVFEQSEKSAKMTADVLMNSVSLVTLRLTNALGEAGDVKLPSDAVSAQDFSEDMIDLNALMERLEQTGLTAIVQAVFGA